MIPNWLIALIFAALRTFYSAAIEGFVTWGLLNLFLPDEYKVSYLLCYAFWYVIGFVSSYIRIKKMIEV